MMIRILCAVAAALALGFAPGPARAWQALRAVDLDASYEDPEGFFALDYPSSWKTNRSRSEMQFWADKKGESGLAVSLQIKSVSAEQLAGDIAALLAGKRDGYQQTARDDDGLIDGRPAVWIEYAYKDKGAAQRGFIAATVRNRVGFLLIGWAPKARWSGLQPVFEAIAGSLRIAAFRVAPDYADWSGLETDHFAFHYQPKTYVARNIKAIAADHERAYAEIAAALGVEYDEAIDFYFYPSEDALYRSTARKVGHANTQAREVHAIWVSAREHQSVGHEMTHVITAGALGEPREALLGEGIAVCLDHSGKDHQAIAAGLREDGRLAPLGDMLGDAWFEVDAEVAYAESGAFVCYLLDAFGADAFRDVYAAADLEQAVEDAYDLSLAALEKRWPKQLGAGS